ncbi:unnamed protein product [Darwinula stevensoni]|uniref:Major facilitator superfamily (MFS) profile domain-containing protein n=1 Tax=Darwinula stevensoni TaxID=69355 RepID=A0A7R9A3D3_9CRUS|nr:unnamed protein product [Darwinula stevensoni]CAG0881073.1 unnamed protein product [Darwinula stevensoni]
MCIGFLWLPWSDSLGRGKPYGSHLLARSLSCIVCPRLVMSQRAAVQEPDSTPDSTSDSAPDSTEVSSRSRESRSHPHPHGLVSPQRAPWTTNAKPTDFDALLPHVGEYGRYQKLLIWLVCLPACIPCGFHAFNQLFMAGTPEHWCRVPELEGVSSLSIEYLKRISIPPAARSSGYSQCEMYDTDYNKLAEKILQEDANVTGFPDASWSTVPCQHGWVYNLTQVSSSIVIDFDLVCSREIFPTVGLCVLNVGGIIGVYLFGVISDRWGRRPSFFLCLSVELVAGVVTGWCPNFNAWLCCRFFVGLTIPAIYQIPFIIAIELVGPNYRAFVTVMTCLYYTFGLLLLAGVAYFVRNWVHLCYATALPFFLYGGYWWFLPESPRWLLSRDRLEEATRVLKVLARINGKSLPHEYYEELKRILKIYLYFFAIVGGSLPCAFAAASGFQEKLIAQQMEAQRARERKIHHIHSYEQHNAGFLDLFRTPNMRKKTLLITLNWFANETAYVGLSYYGPAMGSDEYMSFFLAGLVEIPSYLCCWFLMEEWGRRWPLCASMIVGGTAAIFTVVMDQDAVVETLVLYLIAKFAIAASFLIIYPFAGELYPTEVRGKGIGFSGYIGGLGVCIIPFVNFLGRHNLVLPLIIMGILTVIGGICGLWLPETLHEKLPQTIEDGEAFGKEQRFGDCPCFEHRGWNESATESSTLLKELRPEDPGPNAANEEGRSSAGEGRAADAHPRPGEAGEPGEDGVRRQSSYRAMLQRRVMVRQPTVEFPVDPATGAIRLSHW